MALNINGKEAYALSINGNIFLSPTASEGQKYILSIKAKSYIGKTMVQNAGAEYTTDQITESTSINQLHWSSLRNTNYKPIVDACVVISGNSYEILLMDNTEAWYRLNDDKVEILVE